MIAYFDCFSGISGDMTLSAFIELGVPLKYIEKNLNQLIKVSLSSKKVLKNGISATTFIINSEENERLDYKKIKNIIESSSLSKKIKELSFDIFEQIADAESHIHNMKKDDMHFHEIGSVDTIVDIVGVALCIDYLNIKKIYSSCLPFNSGSFSCHHGRLPLPAPATLEILKDLPLYNSDIKDETVTPTGAAIIKTIATSFGKFPNMKIEKIGYGAGQKDFKNSPNILRIVVGKESSIFSKEKIVVIETNIDDMSPEILSFLMEKLFESGAIDVSFIPIFMKKNRPAFKIEVLCYENQKDTLSKIIFSETSSIGIRYYEVKRRILERETKDIETKFGLIQAKIVKRPNDKIEIIPEYEVCKKIAQKYDIPLRDVYNEISEKNREK